MILPIYTYGQQVLRKETQELDLTNEQVRAEIAELIPSMFETLTQAEGVGLAAPQVGLDIQLLVIDLSEVEDEQHPEYKDYKRAFINPNIYEDSDETTVHEEGCLSLPGIHERVTRPAVVRVKYYDENFEMQDVELTGFLARVFQHEYDHLNGIMFIDHIAGLRKQMIKGKLNNLLNGKVHASYKTKPMRK